MLLEKYFLVSVCHTFITTMYYALSACHKEDSLRVVRIRRPKSDVGCKWSPVSTTKLNFDLYALVWTL